MTKRIRISVPELKCTDVSGDPHNDIEFYGYMYAQVMEIGTNNLIGSRKLLFNTDENHLIALTLNSFWHTGWEAQELTIEPDQYLVLGGHLVEDDHFPGVDANMDGPEVRLSYSRLTSGRQYVWVGYSGQAVIATFDIVVL
jgi:hypothetical protein